MIKGTINSSVEEVYEEAKGIILESKYYVEKTGLYQLGEVLAHFVKPTSIFAKEGDIEEFTDEGSFLSNLDSYKEMKDVELANELMYEKAFIAQDYLLSLNINQLHKLKLALQETENIEDYNNRFLEKHGSLEYLLVYIDKAIVDFNEKLEEMNQEQEEFIDTLYDLRDDYMQRYNIVDDLVVFYREHSIDYEVISELVDGYLSDDVSSVQSEVSDNIVEDLENIKPWHFDDEDELRSIVVILISNELASHHRWNISNLEILRDRLDNEDVVDKYMEKYESRFGSIESFKEILEEQIEEFEMYGV